MVKIETQILEKIAIISINGELDASSSIQLDKSLNQQLGNKQLDIIIDCASLNYISSAGLGVFMSYIEEFKEKKQKMVLFRLCKKVKNVFDILGLAQLMNIVTTKEDAINFLNEK